MIFDYDDELGTLVFQNVQALYQLGAAGGYPGLSAAGMAAPGIPASVATQLTPHCIAATSSGQLSKL